LKEELNQEDIFSLTEDYVKKIKDTYKEKDIYDENYQRETYTKHKKKLIDLNNKLKSNPRTMGKG
jgi:hypothetical protein